MKRPDQTGRNVGIKSEGQTHFLPVLLSPGKDASCAISTSHNSFYFLSVHSSSSGCPSGSVRIIRPWLTKVAAILEIDTVFTEEILSLLFIVCKLMRNK